MRAFQRLGPVCATLLLLSGCGLFGEDEIILEGERVPVRPTEETAVMETPPPLTLPAETDLTEWNHANATPNRVAPHVRLASGLRVLWSVDAGAGNAGRALLTTGPVVSGGRILVLDAAATLRAFDPSGSLAWETYVGSETEDGRDGFGGGVAADGETAYVATGFGEVLAVSIATGEILWRASVDGPVRAAPTVTGGRVFVVTRDDRAFALDTRTGNVIWRLQGSIGTTGLLGGASPAVDDVIAALPFASGEVTAAVAFSGRRLWSSALSGGRRELARTDIGDITGDPVIDRETVYAANQAGRLVSIDRRTGQRNWTVNDGTLNPVLPAGGSLFLISDRAELLRLDAATGARIWAVQLAEFDDPEDRVGAIGYGGPLLAGGRLVLVSTEGVLLSFDPETGRETGRVDLPGGSYLQPAISGGRIYVLTTGGALIALQ